MKIDDEEEEEDRRPFREIRLPPSKRTRTGVDVNTNTDGDGIRASDGSSSSFSNVAQLAGVSTAFYSPTLFNQVNPENTSQRLQPLIHPRTIHQASVMTPLTFPNHYPNGA